MSRDRHVQLHYGRRDDQGRKLCCHCSIPIPKRRISWCGDWCALLYRIRKGDQGAMRSWLFARDNAVCALCGTDTLQDDRARYEELGYRLADPKVRVTMRASGNWDADHIVPVSEGGEHHPRNLRTLCRPCHKTETAALRKRLAAKQRIAPHGSTR